MFHLQVGSHEDESIVIARHLASLGTDRVGVIYDRSPIGRRYLAFLQEEAEAAGVRIGASASVAPLADDADAEIGLVLGAGTDALVYLGLGLAAPAVARAASGRGWNGPRVMNTAGMRGYLPEFADAIDGWTYVDMHSDGNATLAGLRRRLNLGPESGAAPAFGYDMGRLVAEGFARAPERTCERGQAGSRTGQVAPAAPGCSPVR